MSATASDPAVAIAHRPFARPLVMAIFTASGAAGLIYQVVWAQELVLVFGNTSQAVSTIVAAFMAGLGIGALVAGVVAPRLRRPLLMYALSELAVGIGALLVPLGFEGVLAVYRSAYETNATTQLVLVQSALTMAVVTPVTSLMGLTLPFLTKYLVTSMRTAGPRMGALYGANTLGAVLGALVSGLVLIELFGLSVTAFIAVGLNLTAGLVALVLTWLGRAEETLGWRPGAPPEVPARSPRIPGLRFLLYATTLVAGFIALALEVLWTRMLAEGSGSLAYNFTAILSVYLLGIGLGGVLYRILSRPSRDTPLALALALSGVAAATILTVPIGGLDVGPHYVLRVVILLPATICMGYSFPLTARLLTSTPAQGARSVGVLYACNTCGSIIGSLSATFILAPTLGTNRSVLLLGAADAALALVLVSAVSLRRRVSAIGFSPIPLVAALIPVLLVVTNSPLLETSTDRWLSAQDRPYHHVEDSLSTVDAVGGPPARRRLFASGTAMTSLSVDTELMAYLPKAIDPTASRFLDIGFGMGTTYHSAINLGMHTDVVDLSPSVPQQMPIFYPNAHHYLDNPRGRIITADGRNYVRFTSRKYDIISVDPPPPVQSAGAGILYSHEFYGDALHCLRPNGLMVEWLYFGVTMAQLKEQLRTFGSAFPHVLVLLSPMHGGIYMIGSRRPIDLTPSALTRTMTTPEATRDLASAPDDSRIAGTPWPAELRRMQWLRDGQVDAFAGDGPIITDDHPITEYYLLQLWLGGGDNRFVSYEQLRQAHS